jgi:hypothetical protein
MSVLIAIRCDQCGEHSDKPEHDQESGCIVSYDDWKTESPPEYEGQDPSDFAHAYADDERRAQDVLVIARVLADQPFCFCRLCKAGRAFLESLR